MKQSRVITIVLCVMLLAGCSAKNGALVGGGTGVLVGGLLGAGLSKQHVGNGKTTQTAIQVGLVFGLVGALIGSATGYVVQEIRKDDDKKMQKMIQSQQLQGL